MTTKFRTQYDDYTERHAAMFAAAIGEDEGLVQQHMRDECDVNVIMRRYQQTGELTHISTMAGEYGDYSEVNDYQSGLEQIRLAEEMFLELPSSVRDKFNNNPGEFIEFAMDKANLDEMREMGLAPKAPVKTVEAAAEPKAASAAVAEPKAPS